MEPTLPEPVPNKQKLPSQEVNSVPQESLSADIIPNTKVEQTREAPPTPVAAPDPTTQPVAIPDDNTAQAGTTADDPSQANGPLIADDVDVIEKEWVDKAKRIVNATKEDPHQQEKEVSKLQADYLMKRYNKQLKLSE